MFSFSIIFTLLLCSEHSNSEESCFGVHQSDEYELNQVIILREQEYDIIDLKMFEENASRIVDIYEFQLEELFHVLHPRDSSKLVDSSEKKKMKNEFILSRKGRDKGTWIYYRKSGILVHILNEKEFNFLKFNRNRDLITEEEQLKLSSVYVGIAGQSVGSSMILSLIQNGISTKRVKISDFDIFETSNLNRMSGGIFDLYKKKTDFVMEKILSVSPFTKIKNFENGLNELNLEVFFEDLDVVIEEIDDFPMKIRIREMAKQKKIPVISMANVHDKIVINIERYDILSEYDEKIMNGIVDEQILMDLSREGERILSIETEKKLAVKFVGKENVSKRAFESLKKIGTSLGGRPQLSSTINVSGGLSAKIVRDIFLLQKEECFWRSGQYVLDLGSLETFSV